MRHLLPPWPASAVATTSISMAASAKSALASAPAYKKEHLVWEEGFGQRFSLSLLVLGILLFAAKHSTEAWIQGMALQSRATVLLMRSAQRLECWSLLGLLSSSCCVLQLLLNCFSLGCAGFNTLLGPLRPQMLALTLTLQALTWRTALNSPSSLPMLMPSAVLTAALGLLPEMLHLYLHRRGFKRADSVTAVDFCLRVEGMGCTACTVKAKSALEALDGVSSCAVDFKTATARVSVDPQPEGVGYASIRKRALGALKEVGFKGESMSVE